MSKIQRPISTDETKHTVQAVLDEMQAPSEVDRRVDGMSDAEHHFLSAVIGAFGDIMMEPDPEKRRQYLEIAAVLLYFAGKERKLEGGKDGSGS